MEEDKEGMDKIFVQEFLAGLKEQAQILGRSITEAEANEIGEILLNIHTR